jgi:tetratricopeptide (TPR) repeat protein
VAEHSRYAFLWVIVGHSVQYLWVTSYYASRSEATAGRGRWYAKCLLGGAALWGLPALLFGPAVLGSLEYMGGLALLIGACVNLHHFLLDGAIWKLRDGRVARVLLRARTGAIAAAPIGAVGRRSLLRPAIYASGVLCALIIAGAAIETEYGWTRASVQKDEARMREASRRLAWMGRDNSQLHLEVATLAAARGDLDTALRDLDASLAIRSLPRAWYLRGLIYERRGDLERARESFEHAYALTPGRPELREALERVRPAGSG